MVQNRTNRVPRLVQFATASTIRCPETWTKFPALRPIGAQSNRKKDRPRHISQPGVGGGSSSWPQTGGQTLTKKGLS